MIATLTRPPSVAGGFSRGAWASLVLVSAVLTTMGGGSAHAGPADASCVYLALGCTTPTIHSIFDEFPPSVPEGGVVTPDAAVDAPLQRRPSRHASRHRHAAAAKRLRRNPVEPNRVEPKLPQDGGAS